MCGYYDPGQYVPKIFLPLSVIEEHEGCVMPQSELARAIDMRMLPREFAHACPQRLTKTPSHGRVQTIPIKFKLSGDWCKDDDPALRDPALRDPARLKDAICELRRHFEAAEMLPAFTETQMLQIEEILAKDDEELVKNGRAGAPTLVAQRNLHRITKEGPSIGTPSQPHWWPKLSEAEATNTSMHGLGDEITGAHPLNFAFVYNNYALASKADKGCAYAIFYLETKIEVDALSHRHRFGCTDEKELYSLGEAPLPTIWESSVPAFTGRFNRLCFEDPELLTNEMRKVLNSGLDIRCLEDVERGFFAFRKAAFAYKTPEDNELVRICIALGREVGMTIHVDFKPRLVRKTDPATETVHVRKISWSKTI